jgi:hypothetical protein
MPRQSRTSRGGNVVSAEVAELFKKGEKINQAALVSLQSKYGDVALVDEIRKVFVQRHAAVVKGAKRFANAVRSRYAQTNTPYSLVLEKARAHARKYKLSEAEFAEFQRIYEQELSGTGRAAEVVVPLTNMMRVLGHLDAANAGVNVSDADYRHLQEILNLHQESRTTHARVVLQTLKHKMIDAAPADLFDNQRQRAEDHIHPVIVAMFLNKNPEYESTFLHSNIAGIVKARYEKEPLSTRSDYELFYDLVTDPNDIVCDHRSPLADLLHRANLQNQLWNNVLALRNGHVYHPAHNEFLASVDVCRLNKYDNPDFLYGRNDATVLKRILSAFSYRPTVVSTMPTNSPMASSNPYFQNVAPTVTKIPMITVRVKGDGMKVIETINTVDNKQYFIEGNVVVERDVKVIYSRGNVIIYLDRRAQNIQLDQFKPTTYKNLPVGLGGFQKVSNKPINFGDLNVLDSSKNNNAEDAEITVTFGSDKETNKFYLESYIAVQTQGVNLNDRSKSFADDDATDKIVVGTETYVRMHNNEKPLNNGWIKYDGMSVNASTKTPYVKVAGNNANDKNTTVEPHLKTLVNNGSILFYRALNMNDNVDVTTV